MWHNKNLEVNDIAKRIKMDDFSEIAKRTINLMITDHCYLHTISYKDRQRLKDQLNILPKNLSK
ncbi:MAG: hypothetical protein GF372_11945 [Candidatus Marinimicrobia bacterium]|nr:hypothetical protein [Candidatus Neomarinimicrobiota bacterium]